MGTYNGTLSTAVDRMLTAQVDAARNRSIALNEVVLDGYGSRFSVTINGLILRVNSGMVSVGGRVGYLTTSTPNETIPANRNVRVLAQISLNDNSFRILVENSTGSFPNLVKNDIINSSTGIYQILLYSGTSSSTSLNLVRETTIQSYSNANHVLRLEQTLKPNEFYTYNTVKQKFVALYNNSSNVYEGQSVVEFRGNQYFLSETTTTGNTLILEMKAENGIITARQYSRDMTLESVVEMTRSNYARYVKNGITETLEIPLKFNGGEVYPQMAARSENWSWSSRDFIPKPTPYSKEAITYNNGVYTFAASYIKIEFMNRIFWCQRPVVSTFTGRNLVFKFFLDTSTFSISADNDNLQTWAERIRTANNKDRDRYGISFPVCIDGIWQNSSFRQTLEKNEELFFVSIPNNSIQEQTLDLQIAALNSGAAAAPNFFNIGNFYDNNKNALSCEWTRASMAMGTTGGTDSSTTITSFAITPLHPARQDSKISITLNRPNARIMATGVSFNPAEARGAIGMINAVTKSGVARSFSVKNIYDGSTFGVDCVVEADTNNRLVLVGRSL
jgi:hypothetical protein